MNYIKERKPLLDVILLFLIVIGALLTYSLWDKPLSFDVEVKQTKLKTFLNLEPSEDVIYQPITQQLKDYLDETFREDSARAQAKADSIKLAALKGKSDATRVATKPRGNGNLTSNLKFTKKRGIPLNVIMPAGVNSKTQHILLAGDSMAGAAGLEYGFRKYAAYNGHRLSVVSQPSSSTVIWSTQKKLKTAVAKYKPTFIIICLGIRK